MARQLYSTGSTFEKAGGYSRAVVDGEWCFVAGTTGYDYRTMTMPDDVGAQTRNALETIKTTLENTGFEAGDIVRVNYFVTDSAFAEEVLRIAGSFFAGIRPAATMLVCGLIRPEMKVEIEATAKRARQN